MELKYEENRKRIVDRYKQLFYIPVYPESVNMYRIDQIDHIFSNNLCNYITPFHLKAIYGHGIHFII